MHRSRVILEEAREDLFAPMRFPQQKGFKFSTYAT